MDQDVEEKDKTVKEVYELEDVWKFEYEYFNDTPEEIFYISENREEHIIITKDSLFTAVSNYYPKGRYFASYTKSEDSLFLNWSKSGKTNQKICFGKGYISVGIFI